MPRPTQSQLARLGVLVVLLVPTGLLLGLGLASGGFFPDSVSVGVGVVILVFTVRAVSSSAPFSGLSLALSTVAVALVAFATWTLVSGSWSGASARATFEYDRALLYTVVFIMTGVLGRSVTRARVLVYGLTVVSVGISIVAAATWLLPDLLPIAISVGRPRLSWPTSYWNGTGLIAALALVWTSSLSCSATLPPRVRVLAAMAAPLTAATLIFTVSRGAAAVAALGLVLAAVTIRSAATPGGLAALAPAVAVSVVLALDVNGLNVDQPAARAANAGHRTALLLLAVAFAAGGLRLALVALDVKLAGLRAPWSRTQLRATLGLVTAVLVVAFLALGGLRMVRTDVHAFIATNTQSVVTSSLPARERLTRLGNNGRIEEWRVALDDGFLRHPLDGTGAGTYATLFTRYGSTPRRVLNAHSLYIEELSELGIVGGGLIVSIVVSIIVALAWRARGAERELWAALLAGGVMWAVHAGVDWDWQMPAITAWFFAAGGLALGAPLDRGRRETPPRVRFAIGFGCLLLAITPVAVWRSQTEVIKAVRALERGDCVSAEQGALASNAALGSREDPFEVLGYCEAGAGQFALALSAIRAAELRDPQNWEPRYSEALISAAAGLDPRPAARAALARFPTSLLTRAAVSAFSRGGPSSWRRFALSAPLPLPWVRALVVRVRPREPARAGNFRSNARKRAARP